ncbi:Potassium transporter KimA [Paenibacillus allorhizoplanae]|uniref:Potassium transporter KimA n=1 Tax=Paenibacillus allorhizoplanae TaxID=2905648 RepID=A0ABN8GN47_9BACL|nr:APC family permease [Paenibacillus allorhizoplanae]CAH1213399.1 Potassium transporter KimA [Paenibacillus allorhizoplanae]
MTSDSLKKIVFGKPLKSSEIESEKMPVWKALPILSSDALSSVSYGTEQILLELATVGVAAFAFSLPIAVSIIALILLLVLSYRQVIEAYPMGGGAYMVTKENLGMVWGRLTGVSLLIDYTLTVAVSISAGVQAITSAFPSAVPYIVPLTILLVWIMVWLNLRGTSESGTVFAIPTYFFILCILLLVGKGIFDLLTGSMNTHAIEFAPSAATNSLTLFVLLKAFSSGCSAVTGIEAISDAVPHFRTPSVKNAKRTLLSLGGLLAIVFGGVTLIALGYGVAPDHNGHTSVLSMVTEQAFGRGVMYYATQIATMLILVLAANTSFNGFPILASIMAQDKNFPRMFSFRGDRLSYHYGIITLGVLASLLLIGFKGKTDALIPLYAIGVFLSFTLAQTGLVRKWLKERVSGWIGKVIINGLGGIVSLAVLIIFSVTKFSEGAWIVIIITPILLWLITKISHHYDDVAKQLRIDITQDRVCTKEPVIIVPVAGIHKAVEQTLNYAKSLSPNVIAFYVSFSDEDEESMQEKWQIWDPGVRLVVFKSRYRTILKPLAEFIDRIDTHVSEKQSIMVILPQFMPKKWWHRLLHNQSAARIRSKLQADKDIVVATVPYHLHQ